MTRKTAANTFHGCLTRKKFARENCLHTFHNSYYFLREVISLISSQENPFVFCQVTTSTAKQRKTQNLRNLFCEIMLKNMRYQLQSNTKEHEKPLHTLHTLHIIVLRMCFMAFSRFVCSQPKIAP